LNGDVLFVVTGDHGEGFWEHAALDAEHFVDSRPAYCVGHGGTPYESVTQVPLIVDGLSLDGFDSDGPISLIDIAPTILEAVGVTEAGGTTGRSLFNEVPPDRIVLTEAARYGYEKKAVYYEGWKRILSEGDDVSLGFSIPAERVTEIPPEIEAVMTDALPAWPDADGTAPEQEVSKTVERRLEQLGYK
jgi:arylsulfatase A-like enzyme